MRFDHSDALRHRGGGNIDEIAPRISYEDSLAFERVHEAVYENMASMQPSEHFPSGRGPRAVGHA